MTFTGKKEQPMSYPRAFGIRLLIPRLGPLSAHHYWKIGACWLALTLLFEFGFGALVAGMSRQELLSAYTFQEGNIWPLVLLVIFIAPRLAGHLKGRAQESVGLRKS
mgnify:CR=1 FL=1